MICFCRRHLIFAQVRAPPHSPSIATRLPAWERRQATEKNRDKKFVYVFDVISLGTEIRILDSMLMMNGGGIESCIGISSYIEPEKVKRAVEKLGEHLDTSNILNKVKCLFYINETEFGKKFKLSFNDGVFEEGGK